MIEEDVAEMSMGTEISENDMDNIRHLCQQVIEISDYRWVGLGVWLVGWK